MAKLIDFENYSHDTKMTPSAYEGTGALSFINSYDDRNDADSQSLQGTIELLAKMYPAKMLYSQKEAAKLMSVSYQTINKYCKNGKIRTVKFGDRQLININEMAIKKTEEGIYLVDIRNIQGERIRKNFLRKQDALAYEAMIRITKYDKKLIHLKLKSRRYLFEDSLKDFEVTKSMLRPKSIQKYRGVIQQISNFANAMSIQYIDEFTPDYATLFYNELIKERQINKGNHIQILKAAPKTINFYLMTLKAFFKEEVIKDHLQKSPAQHIRLVKMNKKKPDFYTVAELDAFFKVEMPTTYRNFFLGLLFSGMRFEEASNLTWDNIDFEERLILVREGENHKLKIPKSARAIPMTDELFKVLLTSFHERTSDFVFPNRQNSKIKERRALSKCKEIAVKAGITSRVYLHKFRSTYATHLVRSGVSLESIKELLGHCSLVKTERAYANNESNSLHASVNKLDGLLSKLVSEADREILNN